MMDWLRRLFAWRAAGPRSGAAARRAVAAQRPADHGERPDLAPVTIPAGSAVADAELDAQFFFWLTGIEIARGSRLIKYEAQTLSYLDGLIGVDGRMREDLLPRARAIIPQIMHSLRDESQSIHALSMRVTRDPNLVVEVIRIANSVGYHSDTPAEDLAQAIMRVGTEGLRRAIAKVLLKPIFDSQADPMLARAAERLWQHSELQANLCVRRAHQAGLDGFEAYVIGLMHDTGWTALLRALGRSPYPAISSPTSDTFLRALVLRRDRLFATMTENWQLGHTMNSLAREIFEGGFAQAPSPMAQAVWQADREACRQVLRLTE